MWTESIMAKYYDPGRETSGCHRGEVAGEVGMSWQGGGRVCWVTGIIGNWPPDPEGRQSLKKKAEHCRLAGGRFHEQGTLHTRLVVVTARPAVFHTPPTKSEFI